MNEYMDGMESADWRRHAEDGETPEREGLPFTDTDAAPRTYPLFYVRKNIASVGSDCVVYTADRQRVGDRYWPETTARDYVRDSNIAHGFIEVNGRWVKVGAK